MTSHMVSHMASPSTFVPVNRPLATPGTCLHRNEDAVCQKVQLWFASSTEANVAAAAGCVNGNPEVVVVAPCRITQKSTGESIFLHPQRDRGIPIVVAPGDELWVASSNCQTTVAWVVVVPS